MTKPYLCLIALLLSTAGVAADPPDWAPARGHREHGKQHGRERAQDPKRAPQLARPVVIEERYGVLNGRCNREALGTALGGAVGGVIGNQLGEGDGTLTLLGTVVGAVLGNAAGQSFDQVDRGCSQQVLQHARDDRPVQWTNGLHTYVMTPAAPYQVGERRCRNFVMVVRSGGRESQEKRRACSGPHDSWYIDN
jgi:surface antigen